MPTHNIELRSEEIQELLTAIPSAIIRWGITALFFCIILLLSGSYFIKIPEQVTGEFLLHDTTQTGNIHIPVKNSGMITKGQQVFVELDNFPAATFGSITTTVDSLSYDAKNNAYIVHTTKIDHLTTNFGIELHSLPFISGKASVIINEKRVINKILPFINL